MNTSEDQVYRSWAKFLNPETLRSNLITASIFLAAFELLQSSIIERIREFFTYEFNEKGGVESKQYKDEVLSLDKNKHQASLLWLKKMSAINDDDMKLVKNIVDHRNELAHELPKFLANADAEININLLGSIYELLTKIDRWWIKEVHIPTNPDFDGQEIVDTDMQSLTMIFMELMLKIVADERLFIK
ncbi:hypothetical protein [Nostoc sp. TCL240-02]|uniref:hypothetical protein n=1 Tax=Nostoc sp. TCL240-02 TaxID=2572090 RepID=UPI00157FAEB0|nr:hypothetical protein [Nostoc sp. TCL240-02]QKQ72604.1 hypothetical protein FBB35_03770 [Nostoc sp. TCL240-02]